ncbi:MAG TPA: rhomboid family intramembrane serine protease [Cytophagales bacterium]|nr:rhomboid family intramembrane serine protease [Cytophagales bacterium]
MSSFIDDIKNAFKKKGNSLNQIIFLNIILFLTILVSNVVLTLALHKEVYHFLLSWLELPSNLSVFITRPWTLFTYFLLHEDPFHILFNLLVMYWFGQIIGDMIGSKRITALYVMGGVAGGLLYLLVYNLLPYFSSQVSSSVLLGASAGVYAIVTAAATLVPDYTMFLLFFGQVRIKYIALFYLIVSVAQTTSTNAGGNIAHLGGALIGFLFIKQLKRGNDIGKPVNSILGYIENLFTREKKMKVSFKNPNKTRSKTSGAPTQEEIDQILDKISQNGYESLNKEEKQKLFQASQN